MLLLRGGTVIDTFPEVVVRPRTDVLIDDGRIVAVGPGLSADAEVIDASERIVLPGFVDTHRHLWQTGVRGIAVDANLGGYFERVLGRYGSRFRPQDVAAGNLVGALECLDAGITTVQATRTSSGRRSMRMQHWTPWNAAGSGLSSVTARRR